MCKMDIGILCGGKSSRMGTDKAQLIWEQETLLMHAIHRLQAKGDIYLSVGGTHTYQVPGISIVMDRFEDSGPLAGLDALLLSCKQEALFVTAVDVPLVDCELVEELEAYALPGIDAVVPIEENGRIHPLCAIYRKRVQKSAEELLKSKQYAVRELLRRVNTCYVPVQKLSHGSNKLWNMNTPQDYQELKIQNMSSVKPPVFSVVAYSGSGKTTFMEKLIVELKKRELRLAVIKHDGHDFEIDKRGKDTDRFTRAGADVTGIISGQRAALIQNRCRSLQQMLETIKDVDLILTEGFKKEKYPKLLLFREAAGNAPAMDFQKEKPILIVSDRQNWEQAECPVVGLDAISQVADFLFERVQEAREKSKR